MSSDNVMKLLEFVLNSVYFTFQDTQYRQVFGRPMGSPISAILANLVTEHIEKRELATTLTHVNGGTGTSMIATPASISDS